MTSCRCTDPDHPCTNCAAQIDDAEDRKRGYYRDYTDRENDDRADAQAARDWAGRDY